MQDVLLADALLRKKIFWLVDRVEMFPVANRSRGKTRAAAMAAPAAIIALWA